MKMKCHACKFEENRDSALFCGQCGAPFEEEGWSQFCRNSLRNTHIPKKIEDYGRDVKFLDFECLGNPLLMRKRLISFARDRVCVIRTINIFNLSGVVEDDYLVTEGISRDSCPVSIDPHVYYAMTGRLVRFHIAHIGKGPEVVSEDPHIGYATPLVITDDGRWYLVLPYDNSRGVIAFEIDRYHKIGKTIIIDRNTIFADQKERIAHLIHVPQAGQIAVISTTNRIYRLSVPSFNIVGKGEGIFEEEIMQVSAPCMIGSVMYVVSMSEKGDISLVATDLASKSRPRFIYVSGELPAEFKRDFFLKPPLAIKDGVVISVDTEGFYSARLDPNTGEIILTQLRVGKNSGHWNAISIGGDVLYLSENMVYRFDISTGKEQRLWRIREQESPMDKNFLGFYYYEGNLLMVYGDMIAFTGLVK